MGNFWRVLALPAALLAVPALAQEDPAAALDALSRETATATGGLTLAMSQSSTGDLLGALATLDRVLIADPTAREALLLRAGLLCRIDDTQGGEAQLARLNKRDFAKTAWEEAKAACTRAKSAPNQRNQRWMRPGF